MPAPLVAVGAAAARGIATRGIARVGRYAHRRGKYGEFLRDVREGGNSATRLQLTMTGQKELRQKTRRIQDQIPDPRIHRIYAKLFTGNLKREAPVLTGRLRRTIRVKPHRRGISILGPRYTIPVNKRARSRKRYIQKAARRSVTALPQRNQLYYRLMNKWLDRKLRRL